MHDLKTLNRRSNDTSAEHTLLESWWLDTPFGCGWVATRNGRIIAGAPIFRRSLVGWDLDKCPANYKYEKLCDETEESVKALARR